MTADGNTSSTQEQEKEIVNILIDSTLYLGMSLPERQRLLNYLVSSYFEPVRSDDGLFFRKSNRISGSS